MVSAELLAQSIPASTDQLPDLPVSLPICPLLGNFLLNALVVIGGPASRLSAIRKWFPIDLPNWPTTAVS